MLTFPFSYAERDCTLDLSNWLLAVPSPLAVKSHSERIAHSNMAGYGLANRM